MKPQTGIEADYPYRGVPLAPQIIVQLTKELFAGKLVTRQNIVDQSSEGASEARRIAGKAEQYQKFNR